MSVWAIGDLQGCYDVTQRLLEKIRFDPAQDTLWFCGDLVNRGGQSLETLRLVHSLREHSVVVLGNHDLSLLAVGARTERSSARSTGPAAHRAGRGPRRTAGLAAPAKLVHVDRELGWMMVHAGLAPKWTTQMAEKHAAEVEVQLHGAGYRKLFRNMYGDKPAGRRTCPATTVRARSSTCSPACATAPARAHRHRGQGHPGTQEQGLYPGSKYRAGSTRPQDRLRPLVGAGPDHHPGRARHRHRRSLGRQADRDPARYRRAARGAGAGPRCTGTRTPRPPTGATGARARLHCGAGQGNRAAATPLLPTRATVVRAVVAVEVVAVGLRWTSQQRRRAAGMTRRGWAPWRCCC